MSRLRVRMRFGRYEFSAEGETNDVSNAVNTFASYVEKGNFDKAPIGAHEREEESPMTTLSPSPVSLQQSVGEKIKHTRESEGVSQKQLAVMLCKDVSTIRRYERGQISIKADTIAQIADALGVNISELL